MLQQHHKKLNQEERFYISKRIQAGDNQRQIAMDLKRSPSTILREIARNQNSTTSLYSGLVATKKAQLRQKNANRKLEVITTISSKAYYTILEELQKRSSPEQISAILSNELGEPISHQAIYNYIMKLIVNNTTGWQLFFCDFIFYKKIYPSICICIFKRRLNKLLL